MMEQNIAFGLSLMTMMVALTAWRDARAKLHALRRNCFVTNEDDFRVVRYVDASAAVRARAEK